MKRLSCLVLLCLACHDLSAAAWKRHIIDGSSKGADGVRLADINGDGLQDITTGWEQGGTIRVYLNPGPAKSREAWPVVTVGNVGDVEDAVFADLDGDGAIDVVSCAEGKTRQLSFHWAPKDRAQQMNPAAWRTEPLPLANNKMMWMFALPMQVDGKNGTDIFAGGKNKDAALGWLEAPADAHDLNGWKWHELRPVGWLMSLIASDMDGDGDQDVVFSDRKGDRTGAFWLENPGIGPAQAKPWKEHAIGGAGKEAMFLSLADLDGDGFEDVLLAVKPDELHWFRRHDRTGDSWTARILPAPPNSGTMKALSAADVNGDGKKDLIFSCENAKPPLEGMMWLTCDGPPMTGKWTAHELSGAGGVKHDLIAMIDLDGDGDLDAITTEEVKNYGVIWYENPAK